jgi:drug/metabolite transporter (DMT)-like permease
MVAVAAMLWGTDGIFRTALIKNMPANAIVLWEHILLTAAIGWLLWRNRASLRRLDAGDWSAATIIAVGASALATVLFTAAFAYGNPVTVLLLQKTQPLMAISLAAVMLREPLPGRFWPLLPVALIGAYLITFGDGNPFAAVAAGPGSPIGALFALGASLFWGTGTVLGRRLLAKLDFVTVTALRFTLALPALVIWAMMAGFAVPGPADLAPLLGTALLSGLLGLLLYYRGLRETPASVATLCELCFPVTAVILSVIALNAQVGTFQIIGIALLWGALALMQHRPVPASNALATPASTPSPITA